jgi:hypothetical protein
MLIMTKTGLLSTALIFVAIVVGLPACSSTPPTDEALSKRFHRDSVALRTLVTMAEQDKKVIRVADDFVRPEYAIESGRWKEYRKAFRQAHTSDGIEKDGFGNTYVIIYTMGLVGSGRSKGFVFCAHPTNSDKAFLPCSEEKDSGWYEYREGKGYSYRRISGQWYVYSEWD